MNNMKNIVYIIGICGLLLTGLSCSDMNDVHDKYMVDGETTYVGRVDTVMAFPGRERLLIQYQLTDPRVKELTIYWAQKEQSFSVEVPAHQPEDILEVMIGDEENPLPENDYTFQFYSFDKKGHRSVKYETLVSIYGDRFQATLSNRPVRTAQKTSNANELSIAWGGSSNDKEIGVNVFYTDVNGKSSEIFFEKALLEKETLIEQVDLTKDVFYQTLFLPQPEAIDTFAVEKKEIPF